MSKYNDELPATFVERELSKFVKENAGVIECTVGEVILIMGATTDYITDFLQGTSTKEMRSLVVDSTMELTKKLLLGKRGIKYEEKTENDQKDAVTNRRARQVRKKNGKN